MVTATSTRRYHASRIKTTFGIINEGRRKKEEGRRKREEGRGKKEEGRRKKEEGRRKKELNTKARRHKGRMKKVNN
jgi:hypothetical protein